jgi:hypothetical protein
LVKKVVIIEGDARNAMGNAHISEFQEEWWESVSLFSTCLDKLLEKLQLDISVKQF